MKIFLACQQSPHDYPIPAYRFWRTYFVRGLEEAGHEIIEANVDWARGLLPLDTDEADRWREETWSTTIQCVKNVQASGGIDLFLSYLYPRQISIQAIGIIRGLGVPCVNFFCDHVREYRSLPAEFGAFDLHWVPEYKALSLYRRHGWKYIHAPMPCWIEPALRHLPSNEEPVVSFIGGRDPLRASLLASLAQTGLPLEIRGASWQPSASTAAVIPSASLHSRFVHWREFIHQQGFGAVARRLGSRFERTPLTFDFSAYTRLMPAMEDYQRIIAQSSVSLGINRYPDFRHPRGRPGTYSRLRDIEAPMLGACYLTEWTEGLAELYDLDREITVYRTSDELIAQTRALLADPARRLRLRTNGQRRALHEHTVGRSLSLIAKSLGLTSG